VQIKVYIATTEVRIGGTSSRISHDSGNTSINNIVFRGERFTPPNCDYCNDSGDCCEFCNPCRCHELRTITFNPNGGAFINSEDAVRIVEPGEKIGILPRATPLIFSRKNHRFTGWFENPDDETTRWRDNNEVTHDVTLFARWTPTPSNFHVGATSSSRRVTSADATSIARHLVGHDMVDFCIFAADIDGDGEVTIADVTLLARWLVGHDVNNMIAH